MPAKLSVSELKRRFGRELEQEGTDYELLWTKEAGSEIAPEGGLSLEQQREYNYPRPVFLQRQQEGRQVSRSTEYGTLMHSVMQHLDLTQGLDRAGVEKQLEEMLYREIITEDQLSMVNTPQVAGFLLLLWDRECCRLIKYGGRCLSAVCCQQSVIFRGTHVRGRDF